MLKLRPHSRTSSYFKKFADLLFERERAFNTFDEGHWRGGPRPVLRGRTDVGEIGKTAVTEAEITRDAFGIGGGRTFAGGASEHIGVRIVFVILLLKRKEKE